VPGKHIFFRAGNSVLLCFNPADSKLKASPPAHYAEGKQHFAFEVSAAEYLKSKEILQAKGVEIIDEIVWANGKESFYFNDPEGNILEILPEGVWD
jgi:catechol 2,3-dioxygenase-like lactoylglutathione lyase family enzyme